MKEKDLQNRLVQNLKKIRKTKNLTQEKLAEKANLSLQIINDIEGGRRWPRRATLSKITDALKIDVQKLFSLEGCERHSRNLQEQFAQDLKNAFSEVLVRYEKKLWEQMRLKKTHL